MFVISVDADGTETITMLSGQAEINGVPLMAGFMYVLAHGADYAVAPITLEDIDDFTLLAIVGNFDYLAEHLDIDLTDMEIEAPPLPMLQEIANLPIEEYEFEVDEVCGDDCVLQDGIPMLPGRREFDGRC